MESGHPGTQGSTFLKGLAQSYAMAEDWANASETTEAFLAATPEAELDAVEYRFAAFVFEQAGDTVRAEELTRRGNERFPAAQ